MGTVYGMALRFLDIEVDLAPVVDVTPGVAPKGLETRAFGSDAETVTALGGAFLRGLHAGGAAGCLKHWPGIGAGGGDPHYGPTLIDAPRETLAARELAPFRRLGAEAGAIMMGHGAYPALEDPATPASLSRAIATDLLRTSLGFEGLAVSDDMEMHAVSDLASYEEIAARALVAGNDAILFCSQIEKMPDLIAALRARIAASPDLQARSDEAQRRGEGYRAHCTRIRDAVGAVDSWQAVVDEAGRFARAFERAGADRGSDLAAMRGPTGREEWT
jgi:beta-N-acetylhexosaminidase